MRFAVIGDVGGQHEALLEELEHLGVDASTGTVPDDLTLVQVGDLVHRGPASEQVVETVDRLLATSPQRWVQLVGNHEAQYLRHPSFHWDAWISEPAADTLRDWWTTRRLVAAAVVPGEDADVLVTHAGLTEEFWRRDLGSPATALVAAERLNAMAADNDPSLFRSGVLLGGRRANRRAGPLWAEAGRELIASWQGTTMPFSQVHGHSSLYDWQRRCWRASQDIVDITTLDRASSHETTWLDGGFIVGVDPGHGSLARPHWRAWEPRRH